MDEPDQPTPATERPFVAPCRRITIGAPCRWLRLGWADLRAAPEPSLVFGLLVLALSVLVSVLAWWLGRFALLATVLSGFVFIAPLLGVGLYAVSRARAEGQTPSVRASLRLSRRVVGQAAVFALMQLVIVMVWARAGMMVSAFVPLVPGSTAALVEFLLIGSAVGSIFAALTFAAAAFSLPMIADRDVDMVTACLTSVHAVLRNKLAMLVWAGLIVALTALGFATAFLGLVVILPWLAYASWHGYREIVDASDWPRLH